jgi:phosphomannomutase
MQSTQISRIWVCGCGGLHKTMLKFGTSGLRGLVTELTDRECYLYTTAFLEYISDQKLVKYDTSVAIAGDLRPSTKKILKAVTGAVKDSGFSTDYCGIIPTPTVSLYGFRRKFPSIMVTGSHIPYDRNGIKFNLPQGEILKKDEKMITEYYSRIAASGKFDSLFSKNGSFKKSPAELPKTNPKAEQEYIKRYLKFFPKNLLKGKKIVVYQHSSVMRDIMVRILKKLDANVIPIGRSEKFVPIDTESIQKEVLKKVLIWAKKFKPDAIISSDGDGDRPALFDEHGNFIRGDLLGIICSDYLKANSVSATLSCNTALEKCKKFKKINRTRIGSPYVIEAMYNDRKRGKQRVVSYEANGGFLTASNIKLNGNYLRALPTRDSMLPILGALALSIKKHFLLSRLIKSYPERYVWTETVKNFPTEKGQEIINKISKNKQRAKKIAEKLFNFPAKVSKIDFTDGARMFLVNKEIVHIRPSGNAPELRVYLEAANSEKALILSEGILKEITRLKK